MALREGVYMRMWERTLCACFIKENIAIRIFAYGHLSFTSQFIYACERASYSKKPLVDSSTLPYKKEVGLTDLVLPFYGEFHQQLLGIGADEDEWGGRLLTGIRELQGWGVGWGGKRREDQFSIMLHRSSTAILCTEWVSPHDAQYHCDESFSELCWYIMRYVLYAWCDATCLTATHMSLAGSCAPKLHS